MRILNLTQHTATKDQISAGVFEPSDWDKILIVGLLTFRTLPTKNEVISSAKALCEIVRGTDAEAVMIGGASYLTARLDVMIPLVNMIPALHAFSVRESVETLQPDGSVKKTQVFRHAGFVDLGE